MILVYNTNFYVVKNIFDKVDEVFKKRKEECLLLVWQISDLQNELSQIEATTSSYAERVANKNSILNRMIEEIDGVNQDLNDLHTHHLNPAISAMEHIKHIIEKGKLSLQLFHLMRYV